MIRTVLILTLLVTVFTFAACKENTPVSPEGTWTRTIEKGGAAFVGVLEITDGVFNFVPKGEAEEHTATKGRYSLIENEITFEDDSCVNPGTYVYKVGKTEITFTLVDDDCEQRIQALNGTWKSKTQ